MAVREFTDSEGRLWRAWDIRPEAIHPVTRAEDHLADCFVIGWIVFETPSGDQKRRLCPWPATWAERSDAELRELLAMSDPVPPRKLDAERQAAGLRDTANLVAVRPEDDKLDVTDLKVVRTFRFPGGRLWTVCVMDHPDDGGPPALRFTSGVRSIDVRPWPKDWADAPDERLCQLLADAAPRLTRPRDTRRRRKSDR